MAGEPVASLIHIFKFPSDSCVHVAMPVLFEVFNRLHHAGMIIGSMKYCMIQAYLL